MIACKKGLIVILDGLGDSPSPDLDMKTPLEAADTPNFNKLVIDGMCGLVDPLSPGIPVGTHTGVGAFMGISYADLLDLDRGPIEAVGVGMELQQGDVALRCNFATLADNGVSIIDRRAGRIQQGTQALAAELQNVALSDGVSGSLVPATQHRAVLCLSGEGLSASITDTDPDGAVGGMKVLRSEPVKQNSSAAIRTARALNEFIDIAFNRLQSHPVNQQRIASGLLPANGIICRGAGKARKIENILQHMGLSVAVVAAERTVLGLAQMFDFTTVNVPEFTALTDTDLVAKIAAVQNALKDHDLVILHIKGTDICSHDRKPREKRDFIESIDAAFAPLLGENIVIGISADHSTSSTLGEHSGDPVPTLLYTPGGRRDSCGIFGEYTCACGGLGRVPATVFLRMVLDLMGCLHQYKPVDKYLLNL
jgi:2,3-bisphosphoglycerate-independent phosphoglycerate mutase